MSIAIALLAWAATLHLALPATARWQVRLDVASISVSITGGERTVHNRTGLSAIGQVVAARITF